MNCFWRQSHFSCFLPVVMGSESRRAEAKQGTLLSLPGEDHNIMAWCVWYYVCDCVVSVHISYLKNKMCNFDPILRVLLIQNWLHEL